MLDIAVSFKAACRAELQALKPGNVHRWSPGHRMSVVDFERSAEVAAPAIAQSGTRVGARVLAAVRATREDVGQNTNLGILLLCAPLAVAAEALKGASDLSEALVATLRELDQDDARDVFAAIDLAAPGGLGDAPEDQSADVRAAPTMSLMAAMQLAAERDRIAWNYAHGFADILKDGLSLFRRLKDRGWPEPWALSGVYLDFLGRLPDTHVARKHGPAAARRVCTEAADFRAELLASRNPAAFETELLEFDARLKAQQINPGTSADLTVAVRFADFLRG